MITIKNQKDLEKFIDQIIKQKSEWDSRLEIVINRDQNVVIAPEEEINIYLPIEVYGNLKIEGGNANINGSQKKHIYIDVRDDGQCDMSLSKVNKDCQVLIFVAEEGVMKVHGKKNKSWIHEVDIGCKVADRAKLFWDVSGNLKADIAGKENSTAYIVAKNNNLDVSCFDKSTSFISVAGNSTAKIVARDNSDCDISTRGRSSSYIYSYEDSNLKIDANDSSSVSIEGNGNSKVTVTLNSPSVRVYSKKYEDSNIFYKGNAHCEGSHLQAIIR